jgi:hypothetical protein
MYAAENVFWTNWHVTQEVSVATADQEWISTKVLTTPHKPVDDKFIVQAGKDQHIADVPFTHVLLLHERD